ncbi:MAG: hypothetical protein CBC38_06350 [Gammaproteobacteria bacterium TMED78]|nr:MAG: hypothetical protein CBC38_06350 [Gammaproteobacteria bacterium TMED78]|tara:strand:+ start:281 stop:934 length:654 start_codon:yes stop_codon:yes gene_type:complete
MSDLRSQYLSMIGITKWKLNTKPNPKELIKEDKSNDWEGLNEIVRKCAKCSLHKSRTQVVFGSGNKNAELLIIGEAPGSEEDKQGKPFVGRSGKLLDSMLKSINIIRDEIFITNILKCRPPDNRDPKEKEINSCRSFLINQIEMINPKIILSLGRVASQILLDSEDAIGKIRGGEIFSDVIKKPIVASYHPAYLLRNPTAKEKSWQDLKIIKKILNT